MCLVGPVLQSTAFPAVASYNKFVSIVFALCFPWIRRYTYFDFLKYYRGHWSLRIMGVTKGVGLNSVLKLKAGRVE